MRIPFLFILYFIICYHWCLSLQNRLRQHFVNGSQDLDRWSPAENTSYINDCVLLSERKGQPVHHKILLFIDIGYYDVFQNWLVYYDAVCSGTSNYYENLELVCMDPGVEHMLQSSNLSCSQEYSSIVYERKGKRRDGMVQKSLVWMKRLEIINIMLSKGIDLILSDTDAFWLRNPYPELSRHVATSHIIASRGWFPFSIYHRWGSTLCMGFLYIKADLFTIDLFHEVLKDMKDTNLYHSAYTHWLLTNETWYRDPLNPIKLVKFNASTWEQSENREADDQYSINKVLLRMDTQWPLNMNSTFKVETHMGVVQYRQTHYNITLLPEEQFARNCAEQRLVMLGYTRHPSSRLRSLIRRRLANATVAHCILAPGDAVKKRNYLVFYTLWQLPFNITEVVEYIRDDIKSRSKRSKVRSDMSRNFRAFDPKSDTLKLLSSFPPEQQEKLLKERRDEQNKILKALSKFTKPIPIDAPISLYPGTKRVQKL